MTTTTTTTQPKSSETAFDEEYTEIRQRHAATSLPTDRKQADTVGLALSGGGIRSATFCLGVLQALKDEGLLPAIHYLSTVSGGGYIGAWLSANCKRNANWLDASADWTKSIAHLRRYSNYLSPQVGFFSADTWSMFTVWIRNTLLVQLTVVMAMACVLLVPRLLFSLFAVWPDVGDWRWTSVILFIAGVAGIAGNELLLSSEAKRALRAESWWKGLTLAVIFIAVAWIFARMTGFDPFGSIPVDFVPTIRQALNMQWSAGFVAMLLVAAGFCLLPVALKVVATLWLGDKPPEKINYTQGWVQGAVVLPMLITGLLVAAILWGQTTGPSVVPKTPGEVGNVSLALTQVSTYSGFLRETWKFWPFPLSVVFVSVWLLSFCGVRSRHDMKSLAAALLAPFVAVPTLYALLNAIMLIFHTWKAQYPDAATHAFVWGPSFVLYAFSLTIVMLIGMMGRQSTEGTREWWSRLGAWLGIYGFAWMVVALSAMYGPNFFEWFFKLDWKAFWPLAGGWAGTVVAGLFAGNSPSTGKNAAKDAPRQSNRLLEVIAIVAPFLFIAALLIGVATALEAILERVDWTDTMVNSGAAPWMVAAAVLAACAAALAILAARIDINEFSLNAFYRSRLVRCYLGATRPPQERNPQLFTGFDDEDDLPLADLADGTTAETKGPLHIVNCALNLGGSSDLALHTRRGATFTLSPLTCGSNYESRELIGSAQELGYLPTERYGGKFNKTTLGQAISVSGAAVSPNMGYHTSPVIAFLLTVFNVRLGWWFPNPRRTAIRRSSPRFNLHYLFAELFGGANDKAKFLMISDGGHFENLAAYELIRRQCRVVIVCDAECDPDLKFDGLGTLIRMCKVDFGTNIDLDLEAIRRQAESGWSGNRAAVGTIRYPHGVREGILIYLKASMTGHEDTTVLQYKSSHPAFPHESTGDQFYGEAQFESYRRLGHDVAQRTFAPVNHAGSMVARAEMLRTICAPSLGHLGRFTEHSTQLMKLWEQLAANPALKVLDEPLNGSWPQHAPDGFRPSFYLCSELIQLMENVYLDLNLEDTWEHTDNQGWKTLFTRWARSDSFQKTWGMTKDIYGMRFRYFCNRCFSLPV